MARTYSPLRYPGGKSTMQLTLSEIISQNDLKLCHYAEPFAGGGGLALALLYGGYVSNIHLNDIDPAIWSFWHSVLYDTERFCEKVISTPITVAEWRQQKHVFSNSDYSNSLELGFSAFFLNRTNRSGIIKDAGIIGGLNQTGLYKIDCRFNRDDLVKRILRIRKYSDRIHLTRLDAIDFIKQKDQNLPDASIFCIDPPYYHKGAKLYTSFYKPQDHVNLSLEIQNLKTSWIVTYDNTPEITTLYKCQNHFEFDISYSAQIKRKGQEVLIASPDLTIPHEIGSRGSMSYFKLAV